MRDELGTVTMPLLYENIQCICYINTTQAGDKEGNKMHQYAKEVGLPSLDSAAELKHSWKRNISVLRKVMHHSLIFPDICFFPLPFI